MAVEMTFPKENKIPYTEFRKSYGDFEVVIPAINFSSLSIDDARHTIIDLRNYGHDDKYVCHTVMHEASEIIGDAIDPNQYGLHHFIADSFGGYVCPLLFHPYTTAGNRLRIEWCKHMANEIEREFKL